MTSPLVLRAGTVARLTSFVSAQLDHLFPEDGATRDQERVALVLPDALDRMRPIVAAVRAFVPGSFDHLHALQYCSLLYLLSVEAARTLPDDTLADRLFCLNRALNSVDLYHAVRLPEVFFMSHGLGAVLGNAMYEGRLVIFQNVTVGRVGDRRPRIGADVVLYPGASVTGLSTIGDGSVIAAGARVHDAIVPPMSLVVPTANGIDCRPRPRAYADLYFR